MVSKILTSSFSYNGPKLEELFLDKLEKSGLTKTQFEKLSGIERKSLDAILYKTSKQTDINKLIKIGEFLELCLEDLFIIHYHERSSEEIKELQDAMDITFINKFFDLKTLSSLGFVKKNDTIDILKLRINTFFGLNSIYEYDLELNEALYSRTKKSFADKMKDFWIKSSYKYFETIDNPNEYDRSRLFDLTCLTCFFLF